MVQQNNRGGINRSGSQRHANAEMSVMLHWPHEWQRSREECPRVVGEKHIECAIKGNGKSVGQHSYSFQFVTRVGSCRWNGWRARTWRHEPSCFSAKLSTICAETTAENKIPYPCNTHTHTRFGYSDDWHRRWCWPWWRWCGPCACSTNTASIMLHLHILAF